MKTCTKCKQEKDLVEFHIDRSKKDGHRPDCRTCCNERLREYGQTNQGKTVRNRYQHSKAGKAALKRYQQSKRGKKAFNRYRISDKCKKAQKRYHIRHPEYHKAQSAVMVAVRAGRLPRPNTLQCHYGPHTAQEYHHHLGYASEHLLDVVPACKSCHILFRRRIAI